MTAAGPLAVADAELLAWHGALADALSGSGDARAALAAVCEVVRARIPCDRVQVWRGDIRQMTMRTLISAGYGADDAARLQDLVVPMVGLPLEPDFLARKVLVLPDVRGMNGFSGTLFRPFGVEAVAFLLLERGERPLGAMQLSWRAAGQPTLPRAAVTDVVRQYSSLAVDIHARTDEALETATLLSETAALISTIHDPDDLLQAMAAKITEAVGCDWGAVNLLDEASGRFRYAAGAGAPRALTSLRGVEAPQQVIEDAFARAEEGIIEIADVRAIDGLRPYLGESPLSSYVSLPLRREGRVVGLLTVGYCQRTGQFSRRQLALARGLAHHALAALENARLVRSLREVNQVKNDFVAAVSHDLRTPLHIVIGYNDMLLEGAAGDLAAPQAELVTRVRDCSVRFLDLIDGILEIARLDAGRETLNADPVAPREICAALAREVEHLAQPGVDFHWQASDGVVQADRRKVTMILRNLVTNALKFTTEGQVAVSTAGTPEGGLVLRVADTGPGISPDERTQIFEMFRQGDAARRVASSGLGLGLYLVKRLAEMQRGKVELLSGEPGNTVFEVTLPPAV